MLLASTNTRITNLIGRREKSGSGGGSPDVWCVAFPHLSTFSRNEFELKIKESINLEQLFQLASHASATEETRMKSFI